MSDNFPLTPGTGRNAATDQVTYSGDTADVQLTRLVQTTGAEGSKTVVDVVGEVQASPTANTLLGRLKDLLTGIILAAGTNIIGKVGIDQTTPGTTNAVVPGGNVAHDAADSGNPQKVGGRAVSALATATLVAAADRADMVMDLDGAQITRTAVPLGDILVQRVTDTAGTAAALSTFAAVASTRNYVTTIAVFNDSTTNGFIDFRDGTAGSVIFTLPLPAKGGSVVNFTVPLRQPTANTALAYDVSAALTTVYISVVGFQSKA